LTLAGALENAGLFPSVFDLDEAYAAFVDAGAPGGLDAFPSWVSPQIRLTGAALFGFSSVCSSYPVTLRIAECLKRDNPTCTILLGGPQASSVDLATLSAFPFVDFILRGEADHSLLWFVEQWRSRGHFGEVQGLTWRGPFGPQRNRDAPVIENLDDLPLPAYHLSKTLKDADYAFLELGRGCPFACTFCSTNDFFRRRFRVKSPARMLADMRWMAAKYGFRGFNLVHDMFTVDRRKVLAFCEAMADAKEGFKWSCSARTDCVDEQLLQSMSRAGCDGIFFGVETGSERMQRIIAKDLDPQKGRQLVEIAERLGMVTTVSTIIGFPEETEEDLRETLDVYMHAMRQPHAHPQINILAPLPGTPVHTQYRDRLVHDELSSRLAYPGPRQSSADRELVRKYPEIFPNFYLLPTIHQDRGLLQEIAEILPLCRDRLRWLLVAIYHRHADLLPILRAWREHRKQIHSYWGAAQLREYYAGAQVKKEFLSFLRARMAEFGDSAIEVLLACEEALVDAAASAPDVPDWALAGRRIAPNDVPLRQPSVHVIESEWDVQGVVDSLRIGRPHDPIRKHKYYRTEECEKGSRTLIEITLLVARSLQLCDGTHAVADLSKRIELPFECPEDLRDYVVRRLLTQLRKKGAIQIYRKQRLPSQRIRCTSADVQIGEEKTPFVEGRAGSRFGCTLLPVKDRQITPAVLPETAKLTSS
jgi:radical SAM superfamily enzyme YgiQ (UPF0313 family)